MNVPGDADPTLARMRAVTIGPVERRPVVIVDYDLAWPARFDQERERIVEALGDSAIVVEHIGSTAVRGLPAKPIIDVLLVVADSSEEAIYVPALEAAGYELRIREPDWHEHRMLRTANGDVHVHVFSSGSSEISRHVVFRDWLRRTPIDRELYATIKRRLAARDWPTVQHYADAKTSVIEEIMRRASSSHEPDLPTIRPERVTDRGAIAKVVEEAFGSAPHARLVEAIWESPLYIPELSLVADLDGRIVGYVMISYVMIRNGGRTSTIASLSPLAVAPECQRHGIGARLVRDVIARADTLGEPIVVLEGDPRYYGRFGFEPAETRGITIKLPTWAPPEAAQALCLCTYQPSIRGTIEYPPAFDSVSDE